MTNTDLFCSTKKSVFDVQLYTHKELMWATTYTRAQHTFFCKGADNKYFRLYGPWGLHYKCSVLLWELKAAIDNMQINKHCCIQIKLWMSTSISMSCNFHLSQNVQFSCSVLSDSLRPHGLQHARPPCPSPTPGVHPNSCPLNQ